VGFVAKRFHTLSTNATFENRLRHDKVTDILKVGTFLGHSVYINYLIFRFIYLIVDMINHNYLHLRQTFQYMHLIEL